VLPAEIDTGLSRRRFLTTTAAALSASGWFPVLADRAAAQGRKHKSCILLWMAGGPSHLDTFDLKPDAPAEVRGQIKPIATSVPGIQVSEHFPRFARQLGHAAIIRSMSTPEADHKRANYHLHTGYRVGTAGLDYPGLGPLVASQFANPEAALPGCVLIGSVINGASGVAAQFSFGAGPGFLGPAHRPLEVPEPAKGVENLKPRVERQVFDEQLQLLQEIEQGFYKTHQSPASSAHALTRQRAVRLMNAREMRAFDLAEEPAAQHEAYGKHRFGRGCLMARRLIEIGVPFVEVCYARWDHHQGLYTGRSAGTPAIQEMSAVADQGLSALIADLKSRGLLDSTLIIWMGEFGRTPRFQGQDGRDHYSKAWSAVLAGGGIPGGLVIGKTDRQGAFVEERPVSVIDLFATVCSILNIDYTRDHKVEPGGRPIALVEKKGPRPIAELLS
jgi:uncharacterized protein (DUF1501 family)